MILRKPYAFLIKHFKLIHLILTALSIYLIIKVSSLLKYYNEFIAGTESKLNAISHVTYTYLIAIIASSIICLIIYALMRYKKKPKLLYFILIILYIIIAIVINISYKGLQTIHISTLNIKTQRLYRDFLRIILYAQYISIIFPLARGLGFDIKKFNFKEDIAELNLDITDNEEVELTIGNTENLQTTLRTNIRQFKYYYKENKLFINTILIIGIMILASTITINKEIVNKVYKEGETIKTDAYNLNIKNTYITQRNYLNETVLSNDKSFLITKINISSNVGKKELNTSNLIITTGKNTYTPDKKNYQNFIDLAEGYNKQQISSAKDYLFVFIIPTEEINNKIHLIYAGDKKIKLQPVNIDTLEKNISLKLNTNIDLSQTVLSSGNINVSSYEIKNTFPYNYNYEIRGQEFTSQLNITSPQNTILHLNLETNLPYNMSQYKFLQKYSNLKYTLNEEEYTTKIFNNKTPGNLSNQLYIEVDKNLEQATHIYLDIIIRNKSYTYQLK